MKIIEIEYCHYCGSAVCGALLGETVCCDASKEMGGREATFFGLPDPSYASGTNPAHGFTNMGAAMCAHPDKYVHAYFTDAPSKELRRIWKIRSALTTLVVKALKGASSVEAVEALIGERLSRHEAQNLLALVPDADVLIAPPPGVEYRNTGNYIPGAAWHFSFGGCKLVEECEWLDG